MHASVSSAPLCLKVIALVSVRDVLSCRFVDSVVSVIFCIVPFVDLFYGIKFK